MIGRVKRALATAKMNAGMIGWRWVLADQVLRRLNIPEIRIGAKGLRGKVAVRTATSDMYDYNHLLGRGQNPFDLRDDPFNLPANTAHYIIDAGANVGYAALRFKLDFPEARIVALEPEQDNVAQFKKNCRTYPEIAVEQAALWPNNTRLRITNPEAGQNAFQVNEDPEGNIVALTVGDIMERHDFPRVDILKIDIEGSEKALFSSNTGWLDKVNILLIETHDRFMPGCTSAIEAAVGDKFEFRGVVDEYSCYVRRETAH